MVTSGVQPAVHIGNLSFRRQRHPLFWIELVLMVIISIRFARGASKLHSYMDLKTPEEGWKDDGEQRVKAENSFREHLRMVRLDNQE